MYFKVNVFVVFFISTYGERLVSQVKKIGNAFVWQAHMLPAKHILLLQ